MGHKKSNFVISWAVVKFVDISLVELQRVLRVLASTTDLAYLMDWVPLPKTDLALITIVGYSLELR